MELGSIVLLVALVHDDAVHAHVLFVGDDAGGLPFHKGKHFVDVVLPNLIGGFLVVEVLLLIRHLSLRNLITK